MLIAVSIGLAVALYLVLFFAVLHLVDSLSSAKAKSATNAEAELEA